MQPHTDKKGRDRVRNLVLNLSRYAGPLWGNQCAMTKIRRFAPDRLDEFWRLWDTLDNRLREYLEGRLPWSETREVYGEVVIQGARTRNSSTGEWEPLRCRTIEYQDGPDVMSVARLVFLLIFELTEEYAKVSNHP